MRYEWRKTTGSIQHLMRALLDSSSNLGSFKKCNIHPHIHTHIKTWTNETMPIVALYTSFQTLFFHTTQAWLNLSVTHFVRLYVLYLGSFCLFICCSLRVLAQALCCRKKTCFSTFKNKNKVSLLLLLSLPPMTINSFILSHLHFRAFKQGIFHCLCLRGKTKQPPMIKKKQQ